MNAAFSWLRHAPLTGLFLTLLAYRLALALNRRFSGHPLTNSVLLGILLVIAVLLGTGMSYQEYMQGAGFIHMLLGPATVALAVPLYDNFLRLRRSATALVLTLLFGSVIGILSGTLLGIALGLPRSILLSLVPRSVTTPIAMGVAEQLGGIPSVAACSVILTGIAGAAMLKPLKKWFPKFDDVTLGFATGLAAHGIGTARALQVSETAGAFAGLAMGLNGLLTSLLAPIICNILHL